jgi:hypothetical protein
VEQFNEVRWLLVLVVSAALYFPLTVPLAALAYKVQRGPKPIEMEPAPFWTRSTLVALGLALMAGAVMFVDHWLVSLDFPAGFVHLALLLLFLPAGAWYVFWMFEYDELSEGVSAFLVFIGLPAVLFAFFLLFNFRLPVALPESWVIPGIY